MEEIVSSENSIEFYQVPWHYIRLRVFENKVLRRIFGSKRDEVTGEWRRLRNKELYAVYSSPNIIRVRK